jgi:hypothetical protein
MTNPMRYCGRQFSLTEIDRINRWVDTEPELSRQELSRRFCRVANWRKPDGGLKDMSCRVAFLKMDKAGIIHLPAPKRAFFKPGSRIKRTALDQDTAPIVQPAGQLDPVLELVQKDQSALWNQLVQRYHYLGYTALPGAQLRYLVKSKRRLIALLGFGAAAWKTAPRDAYIGWSAHQRKQNLHLIVNNARFLILPWVHSKNLASRILSLAARRIATDWQARYSYRPCLLETFVEKKRFSGTCYKAANWIHVGDTQGRGKLDVKNEYKLPVKSVWLYPLDRDFRKKLSHEHA